MTEGDFRAQIHSCDARIAECQMELKKLSAEMEEASAALRDARSMQDGFYRFVDRKRAINAQLSENNLPRCMSSFLERASEMLKGSEFSKADDNMNEMLTEIRRKQKNLGERYENAQARLRQLKSEQSKLQSGLDLLLTQAQAPAETEAGTYGE